MHRHTLLIACLATPGRQVRLACLGRQSDLPYRSREIAGAPMTIFLDPDPSGMHLIKFASFRGK